jgi:hypothetical protein
MPPIEQLKQTLHPIKVPTFGIEQLILIPKSVHVQQATITTLLVNIHVANRLFIYGNGISFLLKE